MLNFVLFIYLFSLFGLFSFRSIWFMGISFILFFMYFFKQSSIDTLSGKSVSFLLFSDRFLHIRLLAYHIIGLIKTIDSTNDNLGLRENVAKPSTVCQPSYLIFVFSINIIICSHLYSDS